MQLTADNSTDLNNILLIDRLECDGVCIGGAMYHNSLILSGTHCWEWDWGNHLMQQYADDEREFPWLKPFSKITWHDLSLASLELDLAKLEVLLLGTPHKKPIILPQLMAECAGYGIGLETMSIDSACRTYNILAGDGRPVVLMLLQPPYIATKN